MVQIIVSCFYFLFLDRSAVRGTLQEVEHWNGEQDHQLTTTSR